MQHGIPFYKRFPLLTRGVRFRFPLLTRRVHLFAFLIFPALLFLLLNVIFPIPMQKLNRDKSTAVYSKDNELMSLYLANDDRWRMDTRIEEIPPFLQKAVIEYEDRYFYYHPGINLFAITRALVTNIRGGGIICGGSTITMQVARMMEPKPRTYRSKLIEIFRALQLELKFSKKKILEYYFNLAPYGGNIEGMGTAAYFYFGKSPSVLSNSECLALVGLPNSPTRLRPDIHNDASTKHRDKIAGLALERGLIVEKDYYDIISDTMPGTRFERPKKAPHFSRLVKTQYPESSRIESTLDLRIQSLCERALREHNISLLSHGITNGAIVVIENKTRSVRAMVGSRDFNDTAHAGQVNGAIALRSPGSALKPFAYALAFDDGLISPRMMLSDVPMSFKDYSPVNYDEKFRGGIPAEEALKLSLNVPAINIYSKLGDRFYSFLKDGGITTLTQPRTYYGLPLVLGSCEVKLIELTNLYATLACQGNFLQYRMMESERISNPKRILSEGSSFIVSEILSDIRRPELPDSWASTTNLPKIAWKTGTSYGNRDAWCIGYNPEYTVGVWVGNFSGRDSNRLIGIGAAAPLTFDIFNSLATKSSWFEKPESVDYREVCSVSGMIPSHDCPITTNEHFIIGVSPIGTCQMHKRFAIDDETGLRLTNANKHSRPHTDRLFEIWSPDIASWRKKEGYPVNEIPPLLDDTRHSTSGPKPVILSPSPEASFILRDDIPLEHQKILLEASISNLSNNLFWFVDGELFATCSPCERQFYTPSLGKHKISCIDTEGNSTTVNIYVSTKKRIIQKSTVFFTAN